MLGFEVVINYRACTADDPFYRELTLDDLFFGKDVPYRRLFKVEAKTPPVYSKDGWLLPGKNSGWYTNTREWYTNTGIISKFSLQQLPGCCGILLSTHSNVETAYRGKGVATRLNAFRKAIAHHQGYATLLCTDVASNVAQKKVLEKNGWREIHSFINPRTNNEVNISICDVQHI